MQPAAIRAASNAHSVRKALGSLGKAELVVAGRCLYWQPPRQPASDWPAFVAVVEAGHVDAQLFGKLQPVVIATHCMRALQPAAALQAFTSLVQSPHLPGLHWQRSNGAASTGGGDASAGVEVDELARADVPALDDLALDDVVSGVLVDADELPGLVVLRPPVVFDVYTVFGPELTLDVDDT